MTPSRLAHQGERVVLPLGFAGDDVALVEALRTNHPGAKAALFRRHVGWVERIITHVIGFDAELANILQEVFARAARIDPHPERPGSARAVARSRGDAYGAQGPPDSRAARGSRVSSIRRTRTPRACCHRVRPRSAAALRAVYRALDILPTDERIAFALRFIDGMEPAI